jgi:hypothetical protein
VRIGECHNMEDLVAALETARQRRLELRRGWETVWWNNLALIAGDHHATWNPALSQFEDHDPLWTQDEDKKPLLVLNHALTVARTELSKLTKSKPIMDILANSDDPQDLAATRVGTKALDAAEWRFKLKKKRKAAWWWMIATGLSAIYVGYDWLDDTAGTIKYMIDPATGDPAFSEDRQREIRDMAQRGMIEEVPIEEFAMGDLEYKVYSPFQLLPDETCLEWDDIRDLITTDAVDIDVAKGLYGAAARDLRPEQVQVGVMERRMLQRVGFSAPMDQRAENAVQLHTWWLMPGTYRDNSFLEKGKYVRWTTGGKLMDASENFPFDDGRIPFVFFQHIASATSIWPDSVINHIRGPNLEIDKTVSQLIENKDYMANPMWLVATQHRIRGGIKNQAGSIVRYVHVPNIPAPQPVQGMEMPSQVENLVAALREQILELSGQSEVARGRVPTGVRSGVAVAYLQEEDDTRIAPTIDNLEDGVALMGSMTLERYSQFYTVPRIMGFYGRDDAFDVVRFKGADLKGNTRVICQAGTAMPRSKAARQQYALELIQIGVLKDPRKIEQILELGWGEPDDQDKAVAQANRENRVMMFGLVQGEKSGMVQVNDSGDAQQVQYGQPLAVPVRKWHNHQIHLQRHYSVMMDEEFDRLSVTHPEIVRLFSEHTLLHEQQMQEQQQQQMQMLEAAKGAPGGAPAGDQANGAAPAYGQPGSQTGMNQTAMETPDVIGGGELKLGTRRRQFT